MGRTRRSVVISLTTLLCGLVVAAPAGATHVGCGDVIMASTLLDSDLVDCAGDGVVIGAHGITLDLRGHTIDGAFRNFFGAGVDNTAGYDDVTVAGGTIQDFGQGVFAIAAERSTVRDLSILAMSSGSSGVLFADATDGGLIERNFVVGRTAGGEGIRISNSDGNIVRRNSVLGEGFGIAVGGDADRNVVERNDVTGSIFMGILQLQLTTDNVYRHNDVSESQGDGIYIEHNSNGARLEHNTAHRNGDDGIQVGGVGPATATVLAHNRANGNGDLGIEAFPGTIDGGHNRARGNASPAQCTGVAC